MTIPTREKLVGLIVWTCDRQEPYHPSGTPWPTFVDAASTDSPSQRLAQRRDPESTTLTHNPPIPFHIVEFPGDGLLFVPLISYPQGANFQDPLVIAVDDHAASVTARFHRLLEQPHRPHVHGLYPSTITSDRTAAYRTTGREPSQLRTLRDLVSELLRPSRQSFSDS